MHSLIALVRIESAQVDLLADSEVLENDVLLLVVEAARPELLLAHEPGRRSGEAQAILCIRGRAPKKGSSSHPCGTVPQLKAFAMPRSSSSETSWCRVHRCSRLAQPRTSASAGVATPYDWSTTFRAALPAGVPTAPRCVCVVFAHAMSWTSVSTSSSGTTCFTTTSSGIGARRRGSCFWLSSASGGAAGLPAFGFFLAEACFLARRTGFAEGLALGLAVLFVLRGGIVVSTGAACADIACKRDACKEFAKRWEMLWVRAAERAAPRGANQLPWTAAMPNQ